MDLQTRDIPVEDVVYSNAKALDSSLYTYTMHALRYQFEEPISTWLQVPELGAKAHSALMATACRHQ